MKSPKLLCQSILALFALLPACGGSAGAVEMPRDAARERAVGSSVRQRATSSAASDRPASLPFTSNEDEKKACDLSGARDAIAQQLFLDEDFHYYICGEEPCTGQEFSAGLTFREVVLRDSPRTFGCIVGPLNEAMTRIYAVFVLGEVAPRLALIYTGIDISVDPASRSTGFKDLVGSEKLGAARWATHHYVWRHGGYALESTAEDGAVESP